MARKLIADLLLSHLIQFLEQRVARFLIECEVLPTTKLDGLHVRSLRIVVEANSSLVVREADRI